MALIYFMIFKFYNRNDKNQETIGRIVSTSRLQAAKIFAERKQLPLKEFLKIFGEEGNIIILAVEDSTIFTPNKFNAWNKLSKNLDSLKIYF